MAHPLLTSNASALSMRSLWKTRIIANTSLSDDQGKKRLLYEELGVKEYWIVDVKIGKILAFKMENKGSYQIRESLVLPNLNLAILEEALQKTRQTNHGEVMRWLLAQFS